MKNFNYVPSFNYNLASWKKASVLHDSPWEDLGTPILEGNVIMPQRHSTCHKAESQDLTDAQRSEILEAHQATGQILISRLQQAVTQGQQHTGVEARSSSSCAIKDPIMYLMDL
jgi:hypothetical protein